MATISAVLQKKQHLGQAITTLYWVIHDAPGQLLIEEEVLVRTALVANQAQLRQWRLNSLVVWS